MNREHENEEVIDLGAASVETQGLVHGGDDTHGFILPAGISEE